MHTASFVYNSFQSDLLIGCRNTNYLQFLMKIVAILGYKGKTNIGEIGLYSEMMKKKY